MFASLVLSSATVAQTPSPSPTDIYANFIGTWVGTHHYVKDGVFINEHLELNVTETKKRDRLRFDYTYGKKGDKDFDRKTRFMELNPAKSELILQWKGEDQDHYKASGLNAFAQGGLGTFTAIGKINEGNAGAFFRLRFALDKNTLSWQWERSPDGQNFKPTAMFSLQRIIPPSSNSPSTQIPGQP